MQLDNDANAGALGEYLFGAGRGVEHLAYVRLSAGVGLGLILDGTLYRGGSGIAGELGHVVGTRDGPLCRCGGRGCLELIASPVAVAELLERSRGEPVSVGRLLELVRAGDRGACRAVADAGTVVGETLATAVTLLDPQRVIIGGELAQAGEVLLEPIRAAVARLDRSPRGDHDRGLRARRTGRGPRRGGDPARARAARARQPLGGAGAGRGGRVDRRGPRGALRAASSTA